MLTRLRRIGSHGEDQSFRLYNAVDQQLGGMTANSYAYSGGWEATSRLEGNIDHRYFAYNICNHPRGGAPDWRELGEFFENGKCSAGFDRAHDLGSIGELGTVWAQFTLQCFAARSNGALMLIVPSTQRQKLRVLWIPGLVNNLSPKLFALFPQQSRLGRGHLHARAI